jgi:hypothetical protein
MRLTPAPTRIAVAVTLSLLVLLVAPRVAAAGEYSVAACQADSLGFSTRAFVDVATRGMSTATLLELPTDGELADRDIVPMHRVPCVGPVWRFRSSSIVAAVVGHTTTVEIRAGRRRRRAVRVRAGAPLLQAIGDVGAGQRRLHSDAPPSPPRSGK